MCLDCLDLNGVYYPVRAALPGRHSKGIRAIFQDLSPKAELLALATQANKLFSLCLGKAILAATLILISLFNSTADRHTNGLELTSEIIRATPRLEKFGNLLMSLV
jgi:hypothetical protein